MTRIIRTAQTIIVKIYIFNKSNLADAGGGAGDENHLVGQVLGEERVQEGDEELIQVERRNKEKQSY